MCGRFALYAKEQEIKEHFGLTKGFSMSSRYNVAPSQIILGICSNSFQVDFFKWGFIPSWTKSLPDKEPKSYINVRAETIDEKVSFKKAYLTKRCLIPANGYYEWKQINGKKVPFYVWCENHPLIAFAGIWSTWQDIQGISVETCAIITMPASRQLTRIHDRMPLIINQEFYHHWLNFEPSHHNLDSFLQMSQDLNFKIFPVSPKVNNPRFDAPECILSL